ncbi:MAG: hypothetical protein ACXWT2_04995 [Methylovulum sp.]
MSADIKLDTLAERSLEHIERKLCCALHFLEQYELLVPSGAPLLDSSYDDIQKNKLCVESSLLEADVAVRSFMLVFIDCPIYAQLKAISLWTFEFNYGVGLFKSVTDFKANIQSLLDSISAGEVIEPPAKVGG